MIDRDALHAALWLRSHKEKRTLRISGAKLAAELGVTRHAMSRILARMENEGRMVRIGDTYHSPLYRIVDPTTWVPEAT